MFGYSSACAVRWGLCLASFLGGAPLLAHADTPPPTAPGAALPAALPAAAPTVEPDSEPAPAALRPAPPPPVAAPLLTRQRDRGFALLCNFSARLFMIAADGSNTPSQTPLQGGVFGGYKLNRWVFGLGFDISSFDTETIYSDGRNTARGVVSNTGFVFSPGAQVAILRSSDQRIEFLGALQVGLGSIVARSYQEPELPVEQQVVDNQSTFYLQYRIAPGLRFWALPQLAFNLLTGISGDHLFTFIDNPSGNQTNQRGTTAFFLNFGAMGVF